MIDEKTQRRFWAKVDVSSDPDACWPWTGCAVKNDPGHPGYGSFVWNDRRCTATHIALALDGRPRPGKLMALHSCDNPLCVNPKHLRWGTRADREAVKPGHSNRALTYDQAAEIRRDTRTDYAVAKDYDVNIGVVWKIRRGLTYRINP